MMTAIEHTCKNCGEHFKENFCNHCGQPPAHRLTVKHLFHDLTHVFLHADKAIFPFIRDVVVKPGILAREFVDGKRKMFNPIQFYIISIGLELILMAKTDFYKGINEMNQRNMNEISEGFKAKLETFTHFIQTHSNIVAMFMVPIFAFWAMKLLKRYKNNFAEHILIVVFSLCQINIITMVMLIIAAILHLQMVSITTITGLFTVSSLAITYKQFYALKPFTAALKAIFMFVLSYLTQMVVIAICLGSYMIAF